MKKRKDGRYASQVYVGNKPRLDKNGEPVIDEDGDPVMMREYVTVYGATQREVKERVAELKLKQGRGVDIAANDTFGLWADRYVKAKELQGVSFSCIQGTKTWRNHLNKLDDTPIAKVTVAQVQDIINKLADYHDGKPPLGKRSLTGVKQTAWHVFRMAAASRVIEYNPAEYATIPQNAAQKHREALTDAQQQWVRHTPCEGQLAAMIMLYAGLRRGELLALTWDDVNLDEATITISKAVEYKNGVPSVKKPKTSAGNRVIRIPKVLVDFLRVREIQATNKHIIYNWRGEMPKLTAWKNYWKRYIQHLNMCHGYSPDDLPENPDPRKLEMKIQTFTPHQLRHTFASILYLAGVDVLTARDQMGHTDIKTTLGIYTHLDKKYKRDSMSKLDEFLCQSDASQNHEDLSDTAK